MEAKRATKDLGHHPHRGDKAVATSARTDSTCERRSVGRTHVPEESLVKGPSVDVVNFTAVLILGNCHRHPSLQQTPPRQLQGGTLHQGKDEVQLTENSDEGEHFLAMKYFFNQGMYIF